MGEGDRKQDPSGPTDLQAELMEQLRAAKERSKSPQESEWTPEDQAQLRAEMARISFNPEYANPDYPDRKIEFEGEEVEIHRYNNFPIILSVIDKLSQAEGPVNLDAYEELYASQAEARRYPEIFARFKHSHPALYKRVLQLRGNISPKDHAGGELAKTEIEYINSQAYSAVADLARQIDPDYDLVQLR